MIRALVVVVLSVAAALAAQPASIQDGLAARELLSDGLRPSASLEEASEAGAKAEEALQGLRSGLAPGSTARAEGGDASVPPVGPAAAAYYAPRHASEEGSSQAAPSLIVAEPPPPSEGDGHKPPTAKPKRDWGKLIMTWLPIVIMYVVMIQTVINPVGTATFWVRNMALAALIGTGTQLIKEIRGKK